jgi:hypothetical protein
MTRPASARGDSTDNTVLLETQAIHRLIYGLLDLLPVRPTLDKFVDILRRQYHHEKAAEVS